jgi:hypothetical protein
MDNEEPAAEAAVTQLADSPVGAPAHIMSRTEARLRKLAGRNRSAYTGPLIALARGWVSRDGRMHLFAARFLDFVVLTPDHLVLCSTGFFTRRPRRRVFKHPLGRLDVTGIGPEPFRTVRIAGNFHRPIRIELRASEAGFTFARELLACTQPTVSRDPNVPEVDA